MWAGVWLLAAALIAATQYTSRDPDSRLYAGIAARLADEPLRQWIAPEWWGLWETHGPFYEHPAGLFILPAALANLGYPAGQSAYAVNAFYQIAVLILVALIASAVVPRNEARALQWLLQLLPIAFVFRVRANHEYAVLAGILLAVYATERSRTRPWWVIGMMVGFSAVLLVKGVFAFVVPVICALWLFARDGRIRMARHAWATVAMMPLIGVLGAWTYDAAYFQVAGRAFLEEYIGRQLPQDQLITGVSAVWRPAYNLAWYLSRILWYAFPWSIVAGVVVIREVWKGNWRPRMAHQGAWFAIVASAILVVAFSLAHRKADRYIIPVYFIIAAVGAVDGIRRFPWLRRVVDRLDRPWVPPAMYLLLCILRLETGVVWRQFTFWRT